MQVQGPRVQVQGPRARAMIMIMTIWSVSWGPRAGGRGCVSHIKASHLTTAAITSCIQSGVPGIEVLHVLMRYYDVICTSCTTDVLYVLLMYYMYY